MDEKPDVIRHEIEETRQSLAGKLETLEGQVKETIGSVTESVEKVKETVTGTVETVKSSVEDTVESVKRTFDLSRQVDRHPWAMAGCSLLAGMAVGYLTAGRRGYVHRAGFVREQTSAPRGALDHPGTFGPGYQAAVPGAAASYRREREEPGLFSRLLAPFASEIEKFKGMAVAAGLGMLRDALMQAVPPALAGQVREIMDDMTRKAGGQPIREPILRTGDGTETGFSRPGSTPAL